MDDLKAEFDGAEIIGWGVGPVLEKLRGVAKIVVLRGGGLGDLMFALPALAALRAAYPRASLTLLGTAAHRELLQSTAGPVHDVRVLPFAEGVRPGTQDTAELERFFAEMRSERFDLAVQLHGGGRFSNPFLNRLGARYTRRTANAGRGGTGPDPFPTTITSTSPCAPSSSRGTRRSPTGRAGGRGSSHWRSLSRGLRSWQGMLRTLSSPFIPGHPTPGADGRPGGSGR